MSSVLYSCMDKRNPTWALCKGTTVKSLASSLKRRVLLKKTADLHFSSLLRRFSASLLLLATVSAYSQGVPHVRSRAEFATALSEIGADTSERDVLAILGKPDDVRTQLDPGGIARVQTKEIWCYGPKGHLGFPTLGCVYIDEGDRTQGVFGGKGRPPKPGLFTEEELQGLLRLLDTTPGLGGYSYNPLTLIQIVNSLQPLGKEKVLAAMGEYIRVSDSWSGFRGPRSGLFLVLMVLFDLPDDLDPRRAGGFGAPSPPGPKNPHQIPRFPIALVDDIPLMLVGGYSLAGMPTPMEDVLEFFSVNGQLHPKPLTPGNDPLAAIPHLMMSKDWIYADPNLTESGSLSFGGAADEREKTMLMEQVLRLIGSVHRLPADVYGNRLPCGEPAEPAWQKIVADVSALKIKWDPQANIYAFQDGTHLPKVESKLYQRSIWKLTELGFEDAQLVFERKSDAWVDVTVKRSEKSGTTLRPATLSVFDDNDSHPPIVTFTFTNKVGFGGYRSEGSTIGLKAGAQLKAKLVIDGYRTNFSPAFRP